MMTQTKRYDTEYKTTRSRVYQTRENFQNLKNASFNLIHDPNFKVSDGTAHFKKCNRL
jgi:hypothetical protein